MEMTKLTNALQAAEKAGQLLESAGKNLRTWLGAGLPAWAVDSIGELVEKGAWSELNDRFYRYLEFGTGGIRGRTIGVVTTTAEMGSPGPQGTPEHAAIGCNGVNDYTLVRATIGLYRHVSQYLNQQGSYDRPRLVIAHDVRHFSRHFSALAASTWTRLGGVAYIFDGPRSTPQLSFTVRWLKAHCGAVITASHNPSHDNGFKAYFDDGAQVVAPHDKGIVEQVNQVPLSELGAFLKVNLEGVVMLDAKADEAYLAAAAQSALDPKLCRDSGLKVVFTNIHGTGAVASVPLLERAGCTVTVVPEQREFDSRFPTVKSPNPENAEALSRAVMLAEAQGADVVLATDPDCDRMGCAVRGRNGRMVLLTGNQIGSLLTEYRLMKYKELGWIPPQGSDRVAIVKTFVTTALQDAIGRKHGVKVINTLTGFKWIAAKMRGYENALKAGLLREQGIALDYDSTPFENRARLLQRYSTFYAFGCEESYGYLPNDTVRDKDGNAACLMFAEVCAYVKSRGQTVLEYLDDVYRRYGFYLEGVINLYYEGASGAAKIKNILDTYRSNPPKAFGDVAVTRFQDFGRETILDSDGEEIPKQDLYFVTLANGYTYAARGSGTEPKMKFYIFAREDNVATADLALAKQRVAAELERIKSLIEADARARAG